MKKKMAFLYAGQGSQRTGMGKDLYEAFPMVRSVFNNPCASVDLKRLCFESPIEVLSRTSNTQPCMGAFAAAITDLLAGERIVPDYVMGLSLGEYSALYAAGVLSADQLLGLLAFRGRLMEDVSSGMTAKMTAVLGLDDESCIKAVESANLEIPGVECANFNCPGQVVIGGLSSAVELAEKYCVAFGAKRCVPVNVTGPFHTSFMSSVSERLAGHFKTTAFAEMKIPVVFNYTGDLIAEGDGVANLLIKQVMSPTMFAKGVRKLIDLQVETIVEIGPGRVLSGFVKKIAPSMTIYNVENTESFYSTVEALRDY